ncbi:alpha 1,2 mannosyltransferase [Aspergillus pseudonomiae]
MWRRTYLLLLVIRVYFALSPSYLHPDENFQGPEVFAGRVLSYPSKLPWEFTADKPIRSVFPLWPTYDVPISLLKWFYAETGAPTPPPPQFIYYVLRGIMFLLSFVLEDWAVYELVPFARHRRATVVLVASSYVTWTYQTHTFSNSLETLPSASLWDVLHSPIITPINNLLYNSDSLNLALHGLHPRYQHFLVNLPQLLGPAYVMMAVSLWNLPAIPAWMKNARAVSALSATAILSIFPHQEPRFLIPCVPLLLSCFRVSKSRLFLATWMIFNVALGFLMGIYHQGGVVPAQLAMPSIISASSVESSDEFSGESSGVSATVIWWKTYSPPLWLLGTNNNSFLNIETRDLMGVPGPDLVEELEKLLPSCSNEESKQVDSVFVVAPKSAAFLDQYTPSPSSSSVSSALELHELWSYKKHINLDDLDFGTDGVYSTLARVIGRRGLAVWRAKRADCN